MAIELPKETEEKLIASIKQYLLEHLDLDAGDLKASLLLKYVLQEIAPSIYNQAILDAQARMTEMVDEIDGTCHELEFGFWDR